MRWRWRISVAKRSRPRAGERDRPQQLGVAVARDDLGGDRLGGETEPLEHARLVGGIVGGVGADRARDGADRSLVEGAFEALVVALGLEGEAGELEPEGGRLGVDAVRAPGADGVGELARALGERDGVGACALEDRLARSPQLERERRVEHVGGGQPVVDPAPGGPGRFREHVDEGGDVVVGDGLALAHRLDRERRGADGVEVGGAGALLERLGGGDLDVAPRRHPRLVGPDGAELGTRVAGDHRFILRSGSDDHVRARPRGLARRLLLGSGCAAARAPRPPGRGARPAGLRSRRELRGLRAGRARCARRER